MRALYCERARQQEKQRTHFGTTLKAGAGFGGIENIYVLSLYAVKQRWLADYRNRIFQSIDPRVGAEEIRSSHPTPVFLYSFFRVGRTIKERQSTEQT